jgi:hypothetical protein
MFQTIRLLANYGAVMRTFRMVLSPLIVFLVGCEILGATFNITGVMSGPLAGISYAFEDFYLGTSQLFARLQYVLFSILVSSILVGVVPSRRTRPLISDEINHDPMGFLTSNRFQYAMLSTAIVVASLLIALPRLDQSLPIGGDTLYSLSVVQTMNAEGPLWAIRFSDRPLFYLTVYAFGAVAKLSSSQLFIVLPIILGAALTMSTWLFVGSFYKAASGYAALTTAMSTFLMRTSIDLYASFFGMTLFLLTLASYFSLHKQKRIYRIAFPTLLALLYLSYWFLWVFALGIITISVLASTERRTRLKTLLIANAPTATIFGVFLAASIYLPPPAYWGLGSSFANYLGRTVSPVGVLNSQNIGFSIEGIQLLVGEGDFILPLLASIALVTMGTKSVAFKLLYAWSSLTLAMTLISTDQTHAALLFPLPILAGVGLRKLVERF